MKRAWRGLGGRRTLVTIILCSLCTLAGFLYGVKIAESVGRDRNDQDGTLDWMRLGYGQETPPFHDAQSQLMDEYPQSKSSIRSNGTAFDKIRDKEMPLPSVIRRTAEIKSRCGTKQDSNATNKIANDLLMSKQRKALYCPITKAGSTFLRRLMVTMDRDPLHPSPLLLTIRSREHKKTKKLSSLAKKEAQDFFQHAFKFVFTRDPYTRLFSTFVDKLYSPNEFYWRNWGLTVVKTLKLEASKYPCGHGTNFAQFFHTVVSSLHEKDFHFSKMVKQCDICKVDYNMIGAMDHVVDDIDYVSDVLGISSSYQHDPEYRLQTVKDIIDDSSFDAIATWKNQLKKCLRRFEVGRIVWRKLQIRGVIDARIAFPFSESDMLSIEFDAFRNECYKAAEKSISDRGRLSKQKEDSLVAAFATVDENDLKLFQKIYSQDFYVLNYEVNPPFLQKARTMRDSNAYSKIFNWTIPWEAPVV